jgi:hypothetical protein
MLNDRWLDQHNYLILVPDTKSPVRDNVMETPVSGKHNPARCDLTVKGTFGVKLGVLTVVVRVERQVKDLDLSGQGKCSDFDRTDVGFKDDGLGGFSHYGECLGGVSDCYFIHRGVKLLL